MYIVYRIRRRVRDQMAVEKTIILSTRKDRKKEITQERLETKNWIKKADNGIRGQEEGREH